VLKTAFDKFHRCHDKDFINIAFQLLIGFLPCNTSRRWCWSGYFCSSKTGLSKSK